MKASLHFGGPSSGDSDHNCRNFDVSKSPHIMMNMMEHNRYITTYKDEKYLKDFDLLERTFYEKNFSHILERKNANYIKHRKKDRVQTMDEFRHSKRYGVEEMLIQLGDMYDSVDPQLLMKAYSELAKYNNELTKGHCKVLDVALHMDESTPHIHSRHVWVYQDYDNLDKNGKPTVGIGKDKALEQAGIERPYPDEPSSRINNRTVTYTRMLRDKFYEILKDMDLEINTIPRDEPHRSKRDYLDKIERDRYHQKRLNEERDKLKMEKDQLDKEKREFYKEKGERLPEFDRNDIETEIDQYLRGEEEN